MKAVDNDLIFYNINMKFFINARKISNAEVAINLVSEIEEMIRTRAERLIKRNIILNLKYRLIE